MNKQYVRQDPLNVIITGVGGQGNISLASLLGKALAKKGYKVTIGETFGAAQRGGSVVSHLRMSQKELRSPLTPHGAAHLVMSLEPIESLRALGEWGNPEVVVVSNTRPVNPLAVIAGDANYPTLEEIKKAASELSKRAWFIEATDIAIAIGTPVIANMIIGGSAIGTKVLPLTEEDFDRELREQFSGETYDINKKAFLRGLQLVSAKQ